MHVAAVRSHQFERRIAMPNREHAEYQVPHTARHSDGHDKVQRPDSGDPGHQDEQLERRWRKQCGHHQSQEAMSLVQRERIGVTWRDAARGMLRLPFSRAGRSPNSPQRSQGRHRRVIRHPGFVPGHHQHDENVVDLWQRDERRIEKGDGKEAGPADGERKPVDPVNEGFHAEGKPDTVEARDYILLRAAAGWNRATSRRRRNDRRDD